MNTEYLFLAQVDLGKTFGYGEITTLSQGMEMLTPAIFSIATTLVVFYFLFGAFKLLKSGGNDEEVKGAREMITHSVIGFVLLMAAFLVLQFLLGSILGITALKIVKGL